MALRSKDNNKAVMFLAVLMMMAIVFSSSHTAQGAYGTTDIYSYMERCNLEKCMSFCQINYTDGGTCLNGSDRCCCRIRLGHGVGPGPIHKKD
uniref:Knottin scorpion toxin-like domain-containing protein n=1 Tax=Leersia perrieri TaxID=77586 RepID=A0A0D9XVI6_9ORYZ